MMKRALMGVVAIVTLVIMGVLFLSGTPKVESAVIPVVGMSCDGCVAKISNTLRDLDGVKEVNVSLNEKVARVKYDAAVVNVPAIEKAITNLGYAIDANGATDAKNQDSHKCEDVDSCCKSKSSVSKT
jgi:copper ion binding protein